MLEYARSSAPHSHLPKEDPAPTYHTTMTPLAENLYCPICTNILDRPLQLACGAVVCLDCCCKWIQFSPQLSCPCCYNDPLNSSTIQAPSFLLESLLGSLLVNCTKGCGKHVKVVQYQRHLDGHCKSHYVADSPSKMTLQEVLLKPTTSLVTPVEKRATEHLMRRLIDQSPDNGVMKVKTRGQVNKQHYNHFNNHYYKQTIAHYLDASGWL